MLTPIKTATANGESSPFGEATPSENRINRIMDKIEEEQPYDLTPQQLSSHIKLSRKQKMAHVFNPFKSAAIAAALILAICITPLNGTTFAGEIINWASNIKVLGENGFLEGKSKQWTADEKNNLITTEIYDLDQTLIELGSSAFDERSIPTGYIYEKTIINRDEKIKSVYYSIIFKNEEAATMMVELGKGPSYRPEYVSKSDYGIIVSSSSDKARYSEVPFLEDKAMLIKGYDRYTILPMSHFVIQDGREYILNSNISYSQEHHQPIWPEGVSFLEKWYTLIESQE